MHLSSRPIIKLITMLLLGSLPLLSCARPDAAPVGATGGKQANGRAVLRLQPRIVPGDLRIQAVVPARLTRAMINHLRIQVFDLSSGAEAQVLDGSGTPLVVDLTNGELDNSVSFSNLVVGRPYRVRCDAYQAPGTAAENLISTNDSRSYTDITLMDDKVPTVVALKVRLNDVVFDAGATISDIVVTDGGIKPSGPILISDTKCLVSTLAGSEAGYADGTPDIAQFNIPYSVAAQPDGTFYVSDGGNQVVRRIDPSGMVSTLATFAAASAENPGSISQSLGFAHGLAIDPAGSIVLAATNYALLNRISTSGSISTIAGNGQIGLVSGGASATSFNQPTGVAVDPYGSIYVADTNNHCIRLILSQGFSYVWAGNGTAGDADGYGASARFNRPSALALDQDGNLYVSDTDNHRIRKISPDRTVMTLAGSGDFGDADGPGRMARFDQPTGIAVNANGVVYVADTNNNSIRRISPSGFVTTLAGSGFEGRSDGTGPEAQFSQPSGLSLDGHGNLYVADTHNHRIRKVQLIQ